MRDRSYYVYILSSRFDTVLYVGVTNNLIRRVIEHRTGKYSDSFSNRYRVYKLVYFEVTNDPYVAISREKEVKGWTRDRKNSLINSTNPDWEDLYEYHSGTKETRRLPQWFVSSGDTTPKSVSSADSSPQASQAGLRSE